MRRVLRAFPVSSTVEFFRRAGVTLHEEADGKLFPDSNRARDVLNGLLRTASDAGVVLRPAHRVTAITRTDGRFLVTTLAELITARAVVLATGGLSLPKSGSDGAGYAMARALGHSIVPTTPALAPLVLDPGASVHTELSGVSVDAELTVRVDRRHLIALRGALLWTHFGISGPAALDVSRHWLRNRLEGRDCALTASFAPARARDFTEMESFWLDESRARPRASVGSALNRLVPASMSTSLLSELQIDSTTQLAHLQRDDRRRLTRALTAWPLNVTDSRGYNYAEATAGGVNLREIDPATMESRVCAGLYLVGEILDVDGRLGGFNFQWAWSSAFVAATKLSSIR